jgi:quercetin dioxygenase-like cupin family protein
VLGERIHLGSGRHRLIRTNKTTEIGNGGFFMQQSMMFPRRAALDKGQPLSVPGTLRHPVATGGPVPGIDLAAAACQLQQESSWSGNRNAVALVKHQDFRLVLAALKSGARLARHGVRGSVLIQVLAGNVRVTIYGQDLSLTAGQIVSLDPHLDHEVSAMDDALLLLTIGWSDPPALSMLPSRPPDNAWDWRTDESVWN